MTRARRPGPVLLVGALVAVAVLMAALAGPWQLGRRFMPDIDEGFTLPAFEQPPQPSATAHPREAMPISQERWIFLVVLTVAGLLLVILLAWVIRAVAKRIQESRAAREVDEAEPDIGLEGDVLDPATRAMREGARHAAQVLEQEVPPGDAVIAAWVALEASAEKSGIHRDRAQTATEFTMDVLAETPADPRAAQELLDLYLAARFSEHRLTPTDVTRAKDSLATIAQGLGS